MNDHDDDSFDDSSENDSDHDHTHTESIQAPRGLDHLADLTAESLMEPKPENDDLKAFFNDLFKRKPRHEPVDQNLVDQPPVSDEVEDAEVGDAEDDATEEEVLGQGYDPLEGPSWRFPTGNLIQFPEAEAINDTDEDMNDKTTTANNSFNSEMSEVDLLPCDTEQIFNTEDPDQADLGEARNHGPQVNNLLMSPLDLSPLPTFTRRRRRRSSLEVWGSVPTRVSPRSNKGRPRFDDDFVYY